MYSLDCPKFPKLELGELIILKYIAGSERFELSLLDCVPEIVNDELVSNRNYSNTMGLPIPKLPLIIDTK